MLGIFSYRSLNMEECTSSSLQVLVFPSLAPRYRVLPSFTFQAVLLGKVQDDAKLAHTRSMGNFHTAMGGRVVTFPGAALVL